MPQPHPSPPPSGQPDRDPLLRRVPDVQTIRPFDPWNSSSTGHQRAETRGPSGWRESRVAKLHSQFRAGHAGGERISDRVGAGSDDFDQRHGLLVPKEARARALNSVTDMLRNPGTMGPRRPGSSSSSSSSSGHVLMTPAEQQRLCSPRKDEPRTSRPGSSGLRLGLRVGATLAEENVTSDAQDLMEGSGMMMSTPAPPPLFMELLEGRRGDDNEHATAEAGAETEPTGQGQQEDLDKQQPKSQRKIFDGLVIYINGSTHPVISDHKLKRLLGENGARTSIHLGRRQVTHVILGKPSGPAAGAGGGLAGGKLEKEIRRVGGCGIKYVGVEWVLESLKAGKRLPEARFANLKVATRGQQSVLVAFSKKC